MGIGGWQGRPQAKACPQNYFPGADADGDDFIIIILHLPSDRRTTLYR